ncbi:hypothetical protein E2562_010641 [Oryza meyeriana var. granulata]|uniref:Uncharacterized protein n=1 Tax=Oryza meyeriana var. granulata TaxID=110450 RepID=A0A6G1EVW3_9ORYZ|nr:hypothetical protein E2562_010641 [Oryza meyeriana var. granulata]
MAGRKIHSTTAVVCVVAPKAARQMGFQYTLYLQFIELAGLDDLAAVDLVLPLFILALPTCGDLMLAC